MRKIYYILLSVMLLCVGCEWHLKQQSEYSTYALTVDRYDLLEARYLSSCDYSALQEMNINYPVQTNILIEDLLAIGKASDPDVNTRLLHFFQDTTLKAIIEEVGRQYANMDDINKELSEAFMRLKALLPSLKIPVVYSQIGALNQSIIVSDGMIGICLDKYLGTDFPIYSDFYSETQIRTMRRSMIVPDCMAFYLLSCFPNPAEDTLQSSMNLHRAKIHWTVNKIVRKKVFSNDGVAAVDKFMKENKNISLDELLTDAEIAK